MPVVTLGTLTPEGRRAFIEEQIADDAEWLVDRGESADVAAARASARAAFEPEIMRAMEDGERFWTAYDERGGTVGWLWVKDRVEGLPPDAAFLYQITVKRSVRRAGYGTAMLAALERALAATGTRELRLNVWDTNTAGWHLYERAGYEVLDRLPAKRQLRKRLSPRRHG